MALIRVIVRFCTNRGVTPITFAPNLLARTAFYTSEQTGDFGTIYLTTAIYTVDGEWVRKLRPGRGQQLRLRQFSLDDIAPLVCVGGLNNAPEPASLSILGVALAGLGLSRRR